MKKVFFQRGGGNCLNSNAALKVCTFLVTLAAACSLALAEIAYPTVINDAAFWLDASDASTITLDENGNVTEWRSKVGSDSACQYSGYTAPRYDTTSYGIPTVDFGDVGSKQDLKFSNLINVKTVFWVTRIVKNGNAFLLGSTGNCHFHRGEDGQYGHSVDSKFNRVWNRSVEVNPFVDAPDPNRFEIICAEMQDGCKANTLSNDRSYTSTSKNRNGGRQLSELICFNRELTEEERVAVTDYLKSKWHYKINVTLNADENILFKVDDEDWSQPRTFSKASDSITIKAKDSKNPDRFFVWHGLPVDVKFEDEFHSEVQLVNTKVIENFNITCWSISTEEYEFLESIETTGSNWIDTGLKAAEGMVVDADITLLSSALNKGIYGVKDAFQFMSRNVSTENDAYTRGTYWDNNWNELRVKYRDMDAITFKYPYSNSKLSGPMKRTVYTFDHGKFSYDRMYDRVEVSSTVDDSVSFKSSGNILLSHVGGSEELSPAPLIVYSFAIKNKDGNFERMMVPAREKETGRVGMVDCTENKFYPASGEGSFVAGAECLVVKKSAPAGDGWGVCLKVSGYNGSTVLSSVPVLVRITEESMPGVYRRSLGGKDIFFATDKEGVNRLACDVETWNPEGTSLAWVKLPKLSGKDTRFYMFYGGSSPAERPASTEVWSSYVAVLHMNSYGENGVVDESGHGNNALLSEGAPVAGTGNFGSGTLKSASFIIPNYNKSLSSDEVDPMPETLTATGWWKSNWQQEGWYQILGKMYGAGSAYSGWKAEINNNYWNVGFIANIVIKQLITSFGSGDSTFKDKDKLADCWNYFALRSDGYENFYIAKYGPDKSGMRDEEKTVDVTTTAIAKGSSKNKDSEITCSYTGLSGTIGKSGNDVTMTKEAEYDEVRITREAFHKDRINADYDMTKDVNFVEADGEPFEIDPGFYIKIR